MIEILDFSLIESRTIVAWRRERSAATSRTAFVKPESLVAGVDDTDDESVELIEISEFSGTVDRKVPARKGKVATHHQDPEVFVVDDSDYELPPESCSAASFVTEAPTTQNLNIFSLLLTVASVIATRCLGRCAWRSLRCSPSAGRCRLSGRARGSFRWCKNQTLSIGDFAFDLQKVAGQRYSAPSK